MSYPSLSYFDVFFSPFFSSPLNNMLHLHQTSPVDWRKHLTVLQPCSSRQVLSLLCENLADIIFFQLESDKWLIMAPPVYFRFQLR